jgi:ABC-type multidrug transport system fused ATPase/permease subunit
VITAITAVLNYARAYLLAYAGELVVANLRKRLFQSLIRQEIAFFDVSRTGELISRLSADTVVLKDAVTSDISMWYDAALPRAHACGCVGARVGSADGGVVVDDAAAVVVVVAAAAAAAAASVATAAGRCWCCLLLLSLRRRWCDCAASDVAVVVVLLLLLLLLLLPLLLFRLLQL